jgi:hypothetical protein
MKDLDERKGWEDVIIAALLTMCAPALESTYQSLEPGGVSDMVLKLLAREDMPNDPQCMGVHDCCCGGGVEYRLPIAEPWRGTKSRRSTVTVVTIGRQGGLQLGYDRESLRRPIRPSLASWSVAGRRLLVRPELHRARSRRRLACDRGKLPRSLSLSPEQHMSARGGVGGSLPHSPASRPRGVM